MNQQRKTITQMVVFGALAAGLGLFAWFGVYQADEKKAQAKQTQSQLFATDVPGEKPAARAKAQPEFLWVSVTREGNTTVLERQPGQPWRITSPMKARADALVVDALVSLLSSAKFKATVDEAPTAEALKKYGLDSPRFVVEARALVGAQQRSVKLEGGEENAFDGSIFMRKDGAGAVYAAEGGVRLAFDRSAFDLRDKQVLTVDEPSLKTLSVTSPNNSYGLERKSDKTWHLTTPEVGPADTSGLKGMLGGLSGERALRFPVDSSEARRQAGVGEPRLLATATLVDGGTVRLALAQPDGGTQTFVLREDADGATLAEVAPSAFGHLDRNPADLRDKTVAPFKKELVIRAVFHAADGSEIVVEKANPDAGADSWQVTAPVRGPAKVFKVTSVLWAVGAMKAGQVVDAEPKDLARYGLGPTARFVALYGAQGDELARLTIGAPVQDKPNRFYAMGTRRQVVEVDGSRFGEIPTQAAEVLDSPAATDGGAP